MNWLCWHVGTVTDPKFTAIARATGTPRALVLGAWAYLLELGKQNDGDVSSRDAESCAILFDASDAEIAATFDAMSARGMIGPDGKIANWDKRQHQKSTERVKAFRARMKRDETHETVSPVSRNAETHETGQTDRQTDTQTYKDTTHYAPPADLAERVEAALEQDMPMFGLPSACEMLFREGHTELEILDAARAIAARGKRRISPKYFIETARGMKADAARPSQPRKPRYNPADASSPESVADRRSKIAAGMRAAFPGLGGTGDAGPSG